MFIRDDLNRAGGENKNDYFRSKAKECIKLRYVRGFFDGALKSTRGVGQFALFLFL